MANAQKKTEATPSGEKKETWLNWLAITTILFSAAATLAAFRGGGLSTRAVLSQSQASDNWAYFQAKSVKQHTYVIQKEAFQLQALAAPEDQAAAYKKAAAKCEDMVAKYQKEKTAISLEARTHEAERTRCQDIGAFFGLAVPYLQVGIMLSALAALMKKKPVWMAGCVPGAVGLAYFACGYALFLTMNSIANLMIFKG
jgi:predicted naringenin-chalcone synthase